MFVNDLQDQRSSRLLHDYCLAAGSGLMSHRSSIPSTEPESGGLSLGGGTQQTPASSTASPLLRASALPAERRPGVV